MISTGHREGSSPRDPRLANPACLGPQKPSKLLTACITSKAREDARPPHAEAIAGSQERIAAKEPQRTRKTKTPGSQILAPSSCSAYCLLLTAYSSLNHRSFASVERQRHTDNDHQSKDALLKVSVNPYDVHAVFHDPED
jgi:hypothetical protein